MSEACILCEGYHDRAFWKGMLTHLGCEDLKPDSSNSLPTDPWGLSVKGGQFAFKSATGGFIRIIPAGGRLEIAASGEISAGGAQQKSLRCLVINSDSDANADGSPNSQGEMQIGTILELAKGFDSQAALTGAHTISMDGGATLVHAFPWKSPDATGEGLPNQQTLERLLCGAIVEEYGARAGAVENWLRSRPMPPAVDPKEHALSYLAGWYASCGSYEAFCEKLWTDTGIAGQMKKRLESYEAWGIIEGLARGQ